MNKKYLSRLTKEFILCALLYCGPASAQWPTVDIAAIFKILDYKEVFQQTLSTNFYNQPKTYIPK